MSGDIQGSSYIKRQLSFWRFWKEITEKCRTKYRQEGVWCIFVVLMMNDRTSEEMNMAKIRVGVIGVGGIGFGAHLPGYAQLDDAEIVAVCDVDESKLERAAKEYNVPNTFVDFNEMLKMKDLDAVSVCVPNYLHAPVSMAALRAGKHVLCEKPLAMNAEEAQAMVDEAEKQGKLLMIGVCRRYEDQSQQLKAMVESGKLGSVYAARIGYLRRRGVPFWGDWFMDKSRAGGGPLIDIGVHVLDLAWWLMGMPKPVSVSGSIYHKIGDYREKNGSTDSKVKYDVEDSAFAFIRFEGGETIQLSCSWALNIEKNYSFCELYGSEAGAQLDPLRIYTEKNNKLTDVDIVTTKWSSHSKEIEHFVGCIQTGEALLSPASESVEVMKMLDGIYKSAEIGAEVRL